MVRLVALTLIVASLAACGQKPPERPDRRANERLDSIEARLDAAEIADPTPPTDPAVTE
ncbi:lipoprotein [Sphingomicrobium sp. XHP0239]|uniref:lipoprotein n=1 Tax=Sphingomicrobium maritimum TaxID=3133972 RepID=UPI0031CC8073